MFTIKEAVDNRPQRIVINFNHFTTTNAIDKSIIRPLSASYFLVYFREESIGDVK